MPSGVSHGSEAACAVGARGASAKATLEKSGMLVMALERVPLTDETM
jgi:hypothetical protein